jgi:thiol:disulfide interchange protein DsbD
MLNKTPWLRLSAVLSLCAFASILLLVGCGDSSVASKPHISASLISDHSTISPGSSFTLGIDFKLEKGWHIYWKNPGDSGLPPRFNWRDQGEPITVREPLWPYPEKISSGPLVNYGYSDILIPFPATISSATDKSEAKITVDLQWLVCKDECLPGEATLSLKIPIKRGADAPSPQRKLFERSYRDIPQPLDRVSIAVEERSDQIIIALIPLNARNLPSRISFFPEDRRVIANSGEQQIARDGDSIRIALSKDPLNLEPINRIRGVLVSEQGWSESGEPKAVSIDTNPEAPIPGAGMPALNSSTSDSSASGPAVGALTAIISALLGGLLLNLMPCVFPVLSIKALSLIENARGEPRRARQHGWAFTAGVLASFWILAVIALSVKLGGESLGWGFQLQSPTFVAVMAIIFLALGLLFITPVEIGHKLQNITGRLKIPSDLLGSFLNGALATAVATPCTAPFMSTALAATITLPTFLSLIVFTALGSGMSAPYLALTHYPALLRYMPRPGAWMESFRQLMAFPLFATVVWLLRVFARQMGFEPPGLNVVIDLVWGLLAITFAFWIFSRSRGGTNQLRTRILNILASVIFLFGIYTAVPRQAEVDESRARACSPTDALSTFTDQHGLLWESYSEDRLAKILAQGRPILIDFTAEWCITCQVNERVVFSSQEVRDLIASKNVTLMRADWTSKNPIITAALRRYGRNGVPLNVLLQTPTSEPIILPNILTPGIVAEALRGIPG